MDSWLLHLIYDNKSYGILLYVLITTVVAALLSFCVGLERQLKGEQAGVRTHALLAVGGSLLMTISIWALRIAEGSIDNLLGSMDQVLNYDTSRIAAAVVTGIGFLGGGVIIKDKLSVKGLSTASTLWLCTAIGLACGAGFVIGAIIFTVVVLGILYVFGKALDYIDSLCPAIIVVAESGYPAMEKIREVCFNNSLPLKSIRVTSCDAEHTSIHVSFSFSTNNDTISYFGAIMLNKSGIVSVSQPMRKSSRSGKPFLFAAGKGGDAQEESSKQAQHK